MALKYAARLFWALLLLICETSLARDVEVASGSQCIDVIKNIEVKYEQKSGNDLKHVHENGMTFPSVMLALDNHRAELAVIAFSWEEATKQISEKKIKVNNLDKIQAFPIGTVRQVFFTGKGGLESLTEAQIEKILAGTAKNWKDIGGADLPIEVVYQANTPATQNLLSKRFLNGEPLNKKDWKSISTYGDVIKHVAENRGSISFGPETLELKSVFIPKQPELIRAVVGLTIGDPTPEAKEIIDMAAKTFNAK